MLAKRIILSSDGIRVVSDRIKKSIITQLPNYSITKILILPIFIDIEKIKNAPIKADLRKKYPGRFIILMASRLTREKNIGLAVRATKNLIPNHPNILLLIVGSGPECKNLKSQISRLRASYAEVVTKAEQGFGGQANLKLENNIIMEDWSDDLTSYYKTADLFLLTSNYEGYGMTVIEAIAAGLPVLMTDVGVAIGSVIPIGNAKKLTERLDVLVSNSLEREKVLENQKNVLNNMPSKEKYLNLIKQSWQNCFS